MTDACARDSLPPSKGSNGTAVRAAAVQASYELSPAFLSVFIISSLASIGHIAFSVSISEHHVPHRDMQAIAAYADFLSCSSFLLHGGFGHDTSCPLGFVRLGPILLPCESQESRVVT
jgi:hypothetical protein